MSDDEPPPPPPRSPGPGARSSSSSAPARRPRAPTITIDTSAVGRSPSQDADHEMDHLSDDGKSINGDKSPRLRPLSGTQNSPTELRGSNSFDSRDSRPTSPHNISSPTQWNNPQNFLAVPNTRSRGQSLDSNATAETNSISEITYVNTNTPLALSEPSSNTAEALNRQTSEQQIVPDDQALLPDRDGDPDFIREDNPFAFTPGQLGKLFNPKSLGAFHKLRGLDGIEKGLMSNRSTGLSMDEESVQGRISFENAVNTSPSSETTVVEDSGMVRAETTGGKVGSGTYRDRRRIFGDNTMPQKKQKSIWKLMWIAYNDKVLIVLTVAAVIALALGLYQSFTGGGVEWIEGVAIIVAICVVVIVGAVNDWQKERQFAKLNSKKEDRSVKVIRSAKTQEINIRDLVVGDILLAEQGDILPVDGILVAGHGVRCDESSATGESDILKKTSAEEVYRAMVEGQSLKKMDPFMQSGAKVAEGYGRFLVTATGIHSCYGKTLRAIAEDDEGEQATPLQTKLNKLAEQIAKLGSAAALLLFIVAFIKFLANLPHNPDTPAQKGQEFMTILITAVTIVVVAVPEGLPLAVTLALAYATKRMLKDRNLVRVLRSCETMGNATSICSDKTGTLTQNVMTVVAGSIGTSSRFSNRASRAENQNEQADIDNVTAPEFTKTLAKSVKMLWKDSIAINSTAFESEQDGKMQFIGSKTETALLDFARDFLGMEQVSIERSNNPTEQLIPFDSGRKCMGVVIKKKDGTGFQLLVKGASEIMLKYCDKITRDPTAGTDATTMTGDNKQTLSALIDAYASRSLRTIGFIYRDFDSWPPPKVRRQEDDKTQAVFEDICKEMTFLGLVGIQDPLRPGVPEAVRDCISAGVRVRMVTGDNLTTAKAIATECGIFTNGMAIEGPDFRKMTDQQQRGIIPNLQVLARSSPEDKRKLVKRLKEMGETVAVTGDGTNDAPALKAADVGFSMNISGTEVAKEASDIILMDDNFASIVLALMWGRAVNDAVRKFLQFQITVNITAVLLAFISAVASTEEQSVLTAVQLLWVNLIMDTMAALALATDPPTRTILNRKPDPKSAPLISVTMWKMIIGQAIYQLTITLVLYFAGASILNYTGVAKSRQLPTLVFNTFVWMQIFNALNNRRLDNRFNVFEGIQNNLFFVGIFFVMIGGQTIIIFFGGWPAFQAERQSGGQWAIALVLGALSIPVGIVVRLVPDEFAVRLVPGFIRSWSHRKEKETVVVTTAEDDSFNPMNQALDDIKHELAFLKRYKGGRLNSLRFALQNPKEALKQSRSPSRSRASSRSGPHTPNNESVQEDASKNSLAPPSPDSKKHKRGRSRSNSALAGAAMAGIIAGGVAGAWSPIERGDNDSMRYSQRHRSKSDLSREVRMEVHPETADDEPVLQQEDPAVSSQSTRTTPKSGTDSFGGELQNGEQHPDTQPPAT